MPKTATEFLAHVGPIAFGKDTLCQWIHGDSHRGEISFCKKPRAFPKSPYCEEHRQIAYKPEKG